MNIAIIGSRNFTDYDILSTTVLNYLTQNETTATTIVSGGAKGADSLAEKFAIENELKITIFKPDWNRYGKGAGLRRNETIVSNADIIFAFWDGKSSGTKNSIDKGKEINKKVIVTLI